MSKGLARLLFVIVFLVPVVWYLFLQLFGDNKFSLQVLRPTDEACTVNHLCIIKNLDSLSTVQESYFQRVSFGANERGVTIVTDKKLIQNCINQSQSNLVLLSKSGIWGEYDLSREGVDRLMTELDILLIQESYGKDVSR